MLKRSLFMSSLVLLSAFNVHANDDIAQRKAQSVAVIKTFAQTLQGHLQAGMKAGGPLAAVQVCKDIAPVVALQLSQEHGWDVGRTSLKYRNAANQPDQWEQGVLEEFEARKLQGDDVNALVKADVVTEADGKQYFRFMKAIPTAAAPCLACHGSQIDDTLRQQIQLAYPNDLATGFSAGDIRGAFTIKQPM